MIRFKIHGVEFWSLRDARNYCRDMKISKEEISIINK